MLVRGAAHHLDTKVEATLRVTCSGDGADLNCPIGRLVLLGVRLARRSDDDSSQGANDVTGSGPAFILIPIAGTIFLATWLILIDTLKTAFADGRLDKDELDDRVAQALAARTYAELATVTADIPAGPAGAPRPRRAARRR